MNMKFETTSIPAETGRPKAPNPYIPAAEAAIAAREKGEAIKFTPDPEHRVEFVERKLREAGKERGVSIRIKKQDDGAFVIWARDLITRKRATKSESDAATEQNGETAETPAEKTAEKAAKPAAAKRG